jgi:RNA polymerase-interacting CarD/CdnL/TRCF family regulator
MPKLTLTLHEHELVTRALRVLAVELADVDTTQAYEIIKLKERLDNQLIN